MYEDFLHMSDDSKEQCKTYELLFLPKEDNLFLESIESWIK